MREVSHLGIILGDDEALLSTVPFDAQKPHESARAAEKMLQGWMSVRPGERLAIKKLAKRAYDGWELARP